MRRLLQLALSLLILAVVAPIAVAHPPPPPNDDEPAARRPHRPLVEWQTWIRVGYGSAPAATTARPRVIGPGPAVEEARDHGWEAATGADLTLPIGHDGDVRIGPWFELRTSSTAVVGGELVIAALPRKLDMFLYDGEGVVIARAGGNRELMTGSLAYGYRAPWDLFRPARGSARYMIGVRLVATATRAIDDPQRWSATVGVETEPIGALRYLLGIRSWY